MSGGWVHQVHDWKGFRHYLHCDFYGFVVIDEERMAEPEWEQVQIV